MTLAHAALLFGMPRSTAPLSSWVSLLSNLNASTMFNGPTSLQGAVDIVCSVDSVITAVGMVEELGVMIAAVVIAVAIMMVSAEAVSGFVNSHPTLKMLILSFLLLIGFVLVLEGFDQHIPKGYIYFAMAFSVFVEFLNIRARRRRAGRSHPVELHRRYARSEEGSDPSQP